MNDAENFVPIIARHVHVLLNYLIAIMNDCLSTSKDFNIPSSTYEMVLLFRFSFMQSMYVRTYSLLYKYNTSA